MGKRSKKAAKLLCSFALVSFASLFAFASTCQQRTLTLITKSIDGGVGNQFSYPPSITPDGRYVVFESDASNLVSGDTNGRRDIFLYDKNNNSLRRVSVGDGGEQGDAGSAYATITPDGQYVSFMSWASNLVSNDTNGQPDSFIHDTTIGKNFLASRN